MEALSIKHWAEGSSFPYFKCKYFYISFNFLHSLDISNKQPTGLLVEQNKRIEYIFGSKLSWLLHLPFMKASLHYKVQWFLSLQLNDKWYLLVYPDILLKRLSEVKDLVFKWYWVEKGEKVNLNLLIMAGWTSRIYLGSLCTKCDPKIIYLVGNIWQTLNIQTIFGTIVSQSRFVLKTYKCDGLVCHCLSAKCNAVGSIQSGVHNIRSTQTVSRRFWKLCLPSSAELPIHRDSLRRQFP